MSSSTSFERYYEEFQSLTEQVSSKLSSLWTKAESGDGASSSSKSNTDDAELKMVQDLLVQADDIIKQMGLEARSVNENGMKKELLGKVRNVYIIMHVIAAYLTFRRTGFTYHILFIYIYRLTIFL